MELFQASLGATDTAWHVKLRSHTLSKQSGVDFYEACHKRCPFMHMPSLQMGITLVLWMLVALFPLNLPEILVESPAEDDDRSSQFAE